MDTLLESNITLLNLTKKLLEKVKSLKKENEELKIKANTVYELTDEQKNEINQVLEESKELLQD